MDLNWLAQPVARSEAGGRRETLRSNARRGRETCAEQDPFPGYRESGSNRGGEGGGEAEREGEGSE